MNDETDRRRLRELASAVVSHESRLAALERQNAELADQVRRLTHRVLNTTGRLVEPPDHLALRVR